MGMLLSLQWRTAADNDNHSYLHLKILKLKI